MEINRKMSMKKCSISAKIRIAKSVAVFLGSLAFGCTEKSSDVATLQIQMPRFQTESAKEKSAQALGQKKLQSVKPLGFNTTLNPTSLSEFNCFGVLAGGPGFEGNGSCVFSSGTVFKVGKAEGLVNGGSTIPMTVPAGPDRTFHLVGFKASTAADCSAISGEMSEDGLSEPFLLAKAKVNLVPGPNSDISMTTAFSANTEKISDCNFLDQKGDGNSNFGNGADGDYNFVSGSIDLSQVIVNSTSRRLISMSRVLSLTPIAGTNNISVEVNSNWNSSAKTHIDVGDEVMLYVAAQSGANSCGGAFVGLSATGRVTQAGIGGSAGKTFRLSLSDGRFSGIAAAQLSSTGIGTPGAMTFCRIIAVRVPNILNLSVGSAVILRPTNYLPLDPGSADHAALGFLPLRIKGAFTVNSGGSAIIDVSGGGFAGGDATAPTGSGVEGRSVLTGVNQFKLANGGGTSSAWGCGGGGGGLGGCDSSANGGASVGDLYGCEDGVLDGNAGCLWGKFFFGGGGGRDTGTAGSGGGIVRIFANTLVNEGILTVTAKGAAGGSLDDAGGGGGSILFSVNQWTQIGGSTVFEASGGDGSSLGGVGGGGRIHIQVKSAVNLNANFTTQVLIGSTGATAGATAGTCRADGISISGCTD